MLTKHADRYVLCQSMFSISATPSWGYGCLRNDMLSDLTAYSKGNPVRKPIVPHEPNMVCASLAKEGNTYAQCVWWAAPAKKHPRQSRRFPARTRTEERFTAHFRLKLQLTGRRAGHKRPSSRDFRGVSSCPLRRLDISPPPAAALAVQHRPCCEELRDGSRQLLVEKRLHLGAPAA